MNGNSFQEKLKELYKERIQILIQYNAEEELKSIHALYEKYRKQRPNEAINEQLKKSNTHYLKYMRLTKKINEMKAAFCSETDSLSLESLEDTICSNTTLDINSDSNDSISNILNTIVSPVSEDLSNEEEYEVEEDHCVLQCANCKRRQNVELIESFGDNDNDCPYRMKFSFINSTEIRNRKFKHPDIENNDRDVEYPLCFECEQYLTLEDKYQTEQYCWPSFICCFLSNPACHDVYGSNIWRLLAREFRMWWLSYCQSYFPDVYGYITLDDPEPVFDDLTIKIKKWNENIDSATLPNLASACNEMIMPTIMCPWGCSVFIHKIGSLPLDITIQRFIQQVELVLIDPKKLPLIQWCRDDFTRLENDNDTWLMNPAWKIRPSIAFIKGIPRVLTCLDHNGGNSNRMIHTCRWKHALPCNQPDQIAQVVTQSRTVKKTKASSYSTEWQMFEQRGYFSGLDTCNHTEFGHFDRHSILRHEIENKAIANRSDVAFHLDSLVEENIISSETAKIMKESSTVYNDTNNLRQYFAGATFVPLKAAIAFQQDLLDKTIEVTIPSRNMLEDGLKLRFNRYWPKILYPCHQSSYFGCQPILVPSFRGGIENKRLWQIVTCLTQVEKVWENCIATIKNSNMWFGWVVTYITRNCLNVNGRQSLKDPFRLNEIKTIDKIREKLPSNWSIINLIRSIGFHCIEMDSFSKEEIEYLVADESNFDQDVLILASKEPAYNNIMNALDYMEILKYNNEMILELRCIIASHTRDSGNGWDGEIFTRHGDGMKKYWYQHRNSQVPLKKNVFKHIKFEHEYIFIYVLKNNTDLTALRNEYIKLLGGQFHIQCNVHKQPLVASYNKEMKCQCGKKAIYECPKVNCRTCICKICFKEFDSSRINYIQSPNDADNNDDDHSSTSRRRDDYDEQSTQSQNELDEEHLANFVTRSEPNECLVDDTLLLSDNNNENENEFLSPVDFMPTTNSGEIATEVQEKVNYGFKFSGCNILNSVGSLLTRSTYDMKSNRYVNHQIQKLCSVSKCKSIPLIYAEGMLFPSIHWKCARDKCSILGAIPSSLLNGNITKDGFASIDQHIRTRLTCPSTTTCSDPRYITHCYDVIANMLATHHDTRLIIERGLTVSNDKKKNLQVRGTNDSAILGSVDSKQMVKNLCTSQKYVKWSYFLTFTANHTRHFGLKIIREWINSKGWTDTYPDYKLLNEFDQREIDKAVIQASSGLILRIWEEVSQLFLQYLTESEHSPWKKVAAMFARREYQSESGNVAHSHIILAVDEDQLSDEELEFVNNLAVGSIFDVVKCDDVEDYIKRGIIEHPDDIDDLVTNAALFLSHTCSDRCKVKCSDGSLRCRVPNYMRMTKDNTKQSFCDINIQISDECWSRLHQIGLANTILDNNGDRNKFKSSLDYFHAKRWIPPVAPGEGFISPYEKETFAVCQSMQNMQRLDQAGGCCKYTCKYIAKIDKQNYIKVSMNKKKKGALETNSTYLHNTKIVSSDIQQEKEK